MAGTTYRDQTRASAARREGEVCSQGAPETRHDRLSTMSLSRDRDPDVWLRRLAHPIQRKRSPLVDILTGFWPDGRKSCHRISAGSVSSSSVSSSESPKGPQEAWRTSQGPRGSTGPYWA